MKLLNKKLKDKILKDVRAETLKHASYDSPVHKQIRKNLGWWDNDSLIRLKVINPKNNIGYDLNETD